MSATAHLTGVDGEQFGDIIYEAIKRSQSRAAFVGCAYLSTYGAQFLERLLQNTSIGALSVVTDVRDAITHPNALATALEQGWPTRVVNRKSGTFHPKLLVLSAQHAENTPHSPQVLICGSNNMTRGGLLSNVEAGTTVIDESLDQAALLARKIWGLGQPLTSRMLAEYEERFRERNAARSLFDLEVLGVSDEVVPEEFPKITLPAPRQPPSLSSTASQAAWAGLESFTGEYTFQLEFPRDAARVLARLANAKGGGRYIQILCGDGIVRSMRFAFYEDNDMFRLNIPNDVPGVSRAREQRRGIGLIEKIPGPTPLQLTLSEDPQFLAQIHGRSLALGTWGRTPTRLYGWY